ncbi:LysM peptidoglycan-binding domain-containing protein [Puniceicoccus vermicola]|uniref:LysM peptidoglycan-binding domain-containing protein n=1 Tax=Puniceicoccus vermicola TaxID=388746 RepID=A0A7X1B172_9BACT|nr:LysM domain-containing protein [Puniceicoccus vermicola]MBC2603704.1 LysM peptidoglycan-binding domain-containing protein [Puniceicoccus vermicola]
MSIHMFARRICLLLLLLAPFSVSAQSTSDLRKQVANLTQDVNALRGLLGSLRIEVESLQRENAQLKAAIKRSAAAQSSQADVLRQVDARIAAVKAELLREDAETRKDIISSVKKQMDSLASQVEVSLKKIAISGGGSTSSSVPPPAFTEDYPKDGIMYLVESGDTLSGIAAKHNSRVSWIRSANKIVDANRDLHAGETIFVPQKD